MVAFRNEGEHDRQDILNLIPLDPEVIVALRQAQEQHRLGSLTTETIRSIADATEHKSPFRGGHGRHVGRYARFLAEAMGVPDSEVRSIEWGGVLHDLGKTLVSEDILLKPAPLTPQEWERMRQHPATGADIATALGFLDEAGRYVRYHHERFDGTGYLEGLRGREIPLGSRIIAVVDAYDAMTTERPYRKGRNGAAAIQELLECSGTQFDPTVVASFVEIWKKGEIEPLQNLPTTQV